MENRLRYSIVIRTLGKGGDKYRALLDSISKQTVPPLNIYVFIPDGYSLPKEQLGIEKFVHCKKGMWYQRIFGLEYVSEYDSSDCVLVVDDDVEFNSSFAKKSLMILEKSDADILAPTILSKKDICIPTITPFSKKDVFLRILGVRKESRESKFRIAISPSGGYVANTALKGEFYPTQSVQFGAFWIRNGLSPRLRFYDELWIEKTGYALPDDQVFGFKAYMNGVKVFSTRELLVRHLDGGSANKDRRKKIAFASGRNFSVFWHRFLWRQEKFSVLRLLGGILLRITSHTLLYVFMGAKHGDFSLLKEYLRGVQNAFIFIRSREYRNLPNADVMKRN